MEVVVKGVKYNVKVIYKRNNKKTYIRVKDNVIVFTSPVKLTESTIINYIDKNIDVINKMFNRDSKKINEDCIHFLGSKYNLILKKSNKNSTHKALQAISSAILTYIISVLILPCQHLLKYQPPVGMALQSVGLNI